MNLDKQNIEMLFRGRIDLLPSDPLVLFYWLKVMNSDPASPQKYRLETLMGGEVGVDSTVGDSTADTLAHLARVPSLDIARGVAVVHGKADKYLKLLQRFVDIHAGDMPQLLESLTQGDKDTARRLAHSLRGAAATLAIGHLAEAALSLETKLRQDESVHSDNIGAEIEVINDEFAALAAALPPPAG